MASGKTSRLPTLSSEGCLSKEFTHSVFPVCEAPSTTNKGSVGGPHERWVASQALATGTSGKGW